METQTTSVAKSPAKSQAPAKRGRGRPRKVAAAPQTYRGRAASAPLYLRGRLWSDGWSIFDSSEFSAGDLEILKESDLVVVEAI